VARPFDGALALALRVKLAVERLAMKLFTVSPFAGRASAPRDP
jgi:hypothetical protein